MSSNFQSPRSYSADDIDREIVKIDMREKENAIKRRQLRTLRNLLVVSGRLPPELLRDIFLYTASSRSWALDAAPNPVSQVCHYWRLLALSIPAIWSHIHFGQFKWALEQLKRSGIHPLAVMVPQNRLHSISLPIITSILTQGHRLQHVSVFANTEAHMVEVVEALRSPAPNAETLILKVVFNATGRFVLPNDILGTDRIRLRRLRLRGCCVDWSVFDFHRLVDLRIKFLESAPCQNRPSLQAFVGVLGALKMVRTLILHHCLPLNDWSVEIIPLSVSLPHLLRLEVCDELPNVAFLVNQLCVRHHATVILRVVHVGEEDDDIADLVFYGSSISGCDTSLASLFVSKVADEHVIVRGRRQSAEASVPIAIGDVDFTFDLSWDVWQIRSLAESAMAVVHHLLGEHTLFLTLDDVGALSEEIWVDVSRVCFRLRYLHVENETASSLIPLLTPRNRARTVGEQRSAFLFPTLHTLSFRAINLTDFRISRLFDALVQRSSVMGSLPLLMIRDCDVANPAHINYLGSAVGSLDWDGHCMRLVDDDIQSDVSTNVGADD
ncbi:hypothetical protein HWV62_8851 [Athelia sp. TMB]|nr:hypothetical protein HWV62_8851 [Athelia sp. TMB]